MINNKNRNILTIIVLFALFNLIGCSEDSMDVGNNLINPRSYTTYIDTVSVRLSTVKSDSIITSEKKLALIGQTKIEGYGKVKSTSFIPIEYANDYKKGTNYDKNEVFDSLTLTLHYSGYYKGDTINPIQLSFHEVIADSFTVQRRKIFNSDYEEEYSDFAYKFDQLEYSNEPFIASEVYPRPTAKRTIELKLSDEMFDFFKDYVISNDSVSFHLTRFKGFAVRTISEKTNCMLGFLVNDTSCCFKLYSHTYSESKNEIKRIFKIKKSNQQFNSIESKSDYPSLNQPNIFLNKIDEATLNNNAILSGLIGLNPRIDFPYLEDLMLTSDKSYLLRASLILKPNMHIMEIKDLPKEINLVKVNKSNIITEYFYNESDGRILTGNLHVDELPGSDPYYSFNITSFLGEVIAYSYLDKETGLMITLPNSENSTTFNSLILGGYSNKDYKTDLNIYYYNVE